MKFWKFGFLSQYLTILLIICGVGIAGSASAATPSSILVDVVPANPAPFENTTISLNSYADNLDSVLITWSSDGKNVLSGIGKKTFSLNAPAAGSEISVMATISLPDGDVETRMVIRPSEMILLWQANDSYVPPFYRGKALPTPDSEIKVVAMPEIRTNTGLMNSKNMTYLWKKDYTNIPDSSGYGKNFLVYTNDYLENANNISAVASTVDQNYSSEASVDIGATQPKILFYRVDDSIGTIWQNALANPYKIQSAEVLKAIPYYISPKEIQNPILSWSWYINENLVNVQGFKKNLMPLQAQSGVSGTSKLRLDIGNRYKIFQNISREINIEF